MKEVMMVSEKSVNGKLMRETKYLAYFMIDLLNGDVRLYVIIDKEKKTILGVGLSRRQVFESAKDNADKRTLEKIEDLELQ